MKKGKGGIVASNRTITADVDLRLCRFFSLSGYWMRAQVAYDTEVAEETLATPLGKIKPWKGRGLMQITRPNQRFQTDGR